LTSCVLVGLAAGIGAVAMLTLQRQRLISGIDSGARTQATNVAALAEQGTLPKGLVVLAGDLDVIQVVDAQGRVVAASANIAGEPPIASFPAAGPGVGRGAGHAARTVKTPVGSDVNFRVVAVAARTPNGRDLVVYAGGSLGPVNDSLAATTVALAWGGPLLVVLVGLLIWRVVGRALAPVEAIRSQVAELSSANLHQRVPEPATGDEIARLARTMNFLLERLEGASKRQRQFIADAAHELLSPLAVARAELEVSLTHPETQDWQTTTQDVLQVCTEMEQLVRDLLFLARSDEAQQPALTDVLDLRPIVAAEIASISARTAVAIELSADEHASVRGDGDQLRRLTRNLLENAARHAYSQVAVELHCQQHVVVLAVSDDGPGIPLADRESVFERFTRLDPARNRTHSGVGLGLAISRTIAQRHGGDVHVEDPGLLPGARLVVRLPRRQDD